MKIRKKATFLVVISNPIYKFFKEVVVFDVELSPTFLNTGTTSETFQQSGKQDSFRHVLKSSASMHESSDWQFFRITTGIQSGQDTFDEWRFVMIFLTILGVVEICSFRLVLEGKIKRYQSHQVCSSQKSF